MKTITKQVKENVQAYVLSCIDFSDYDNVPNTIKEAFRHYLDQSGPRYYQQPTVNHFRHFMEGLPGWFNLEYYNDGIVELMISWGLPATDKHGKQFDTDKSIDLYYQLLFNAWSELLDKEGISIYSNQLN